MGRSSRLFGRLGLHGFHGRDFSLLYHVVNFLPLLILVHLPFLGFGTFLVGRDAVLCRALFAIFALLLLLLAILIVAVVTMSGHHCSAHHRAWEKLVIGFITSARSTERPSRRPKPSSRGEPSCSPEARIAHALRRARRSWRCWLALPWVLVRLRGLRRLRSLPGRHLLRKLALCPKEKERSMQLDRLPAAIILSHAS